MSAEMIRLIINMNQKELENQLALQCAPLLMGIKISNILIVDRENYNRVIKMFQRTGISCYLLCEAEQRITFLLYQEEELMQYLKEKKVWKAMRKFGYNRQDITDILEKIAVRYVSYMRKDSEFPHELGLVLGYPVEDVLGFIEQGGKNYLCSGYWKVYGNVEEAVKTFEAYNQAKEAVVKMVASGMGISSILNFRLEQNKTKQTAAASVA